MLAVSFFSVVGEYMRLLLFICLPVVILVSALAAWLHFRQKKRLLKQQLNNNSDDQITLVVPDPSELIAISPLANEDKFNLVKECRKQLTRSKAKFSALKQDLLIAASKFSKQGITEDYSNNMKNLVSKITAYETQVAELQSKLEVLQTVLPIQENSSDIQALLHQKEADIVRLNKILDDRTEQIKSLELLLEESKEQLTIVNKLATSVINPSKNEVLN